MQKNPVLGGPSFTLHIGLRELALFYKLLISIMVGWYRYSKKRKGKNLIFQLLLIKLHTVFTKGYLKKFCQPVIV